MQLHEIYTHKEASHEGLENKGLRVQKIGTSRGK